MSYDVNNAWPSWFYSSEKHIMESLSMLTTSELGKCIRSSRALKLKDLKVNMTRAMRSKNSSSGEELCAALCGAFKSFRDNILTATVSDFEFLCKDIGLIVERDVARGRNWRLCSSSSVRVGHSE